LAREGIAQVTRGAGEESICGRLPRDPDAHFGRNPVSPPAVRPEWRALLLLLYVVGGASLIISAAEPITLAALALFAGPAPSDRAFEIAARGGIGLAIVALALAGMLIARERPNLRRLGPVTIGLTALPAGLGALTLVMASAWIGGVAIGGLHHRTADGGLLALGSLLILLGVVGEELLLRGLLQPVLVRTWGAAAGVLVTSLAFMVIHMVGGWGHPVSLLNILLAGIWFGLLAFRTGGLAAPILAHFGYNWAEEMLFGATPNPGVGAFGSIVDVDLVGQAIWGGSPEGLNASLAVSVVLVALITSLALGGRQRIATGGKATAQT
jgi:membrane protease YdiL (CAAX protease family)